MNDPNVGWGGLVAGGVPDDIHGGWFVLAFGLVAILGVLLAIRSGRIPASYRTRCGGVEVVDVRRDSVPIQFWVRVMMQLLVGLALVFLGIQWLTLG